MRVLLLLGLAACGDEGGTVAASTRSADEFLGPVDRLIEFSPADDPSSSSVLLLVGLDTWEFRSGAHWNTASALFTLDAVSDGGLYVGGELLLPERLSVGARQEGVEVTEIGAIEVYYGTFPDAVRVDVGEGTWAGTAAFAADIGPIELSYEGTDWQLATYE